ncbi:hypothetical protein BC940DRAFT_349940 [Gongronella butleri]|nr:hypothetical protein BC940DRAFT_349940 [Gongronella butleri]
MLLLFLPLFMGLVPMIHGLCISLNTSLFCRGFGSFAVDPSLIPWLGNQSIITSAQDLDQHVAAAVVSPTWWDNSFHCTSTAASIVLAPLMASTIVCSQMIGMSAAQCNMLAANSSRLCPDTCSAITTALAGSMCSVQQPNPLCNTTIPAANTTCIHAYQNQAQCTGNFTQDQWCHYCQSAGNYADPCCGQQASTCATRGLSIAAIVAIAIVGTLGLLILAGCAWHCLAPRLNTRQNEPNSSFSSTLQKTTRKWWPFAKTNDRYHTLSPDTSPLLKAQQQLVRNSDAKVAAATINPFAASSIGAMSHTTRASAASATSVISADAPPLKYTLTSAVRDDPCFYEAIYVNKADWAVDLTLAKDDLIYVFCYTNEDWAIGYNLHTGMQGYFPLICIRSIPMAAVWTKRAIASAEPVHDPHGPSVVG